MDANSGRFVDDAEAGPWMPRFEIGEVIKVKGEEFEVERIEERQLVLKPLSFMERLVRETQALGGIQELRQEMVRLGDLNRHARRTREALVRRGKK